MALSFKKPAPPTPEDIAAKGLAIVSKALTLYTGELLGIEAMRKKATDKYFAALKEAEAVLRGQIQGAMKGGQQTLQVITQDALKSTQDILRGKTQ